MTRYSQTIIKCLFSVEKTNKNRIANPKNIFASKDAVTELELGVP